MTADRHPLSLDIQEDIIEVFHEVLGSIGDQEKIDLFLYSRGGSTIVPLPLVRLIRKYCRKFSVIVPFRAHGAATMICIGADEVYMTRKAELGPVDIQVNLQTPLGQKIFSTNDLFAYLDFAKQEIGWQVSNMESSFTLLEFFHKYSQLSPDLIGQIYRLYMQSSKYIMELAIHRSDGFSLDKEIVNQLAETLVRGFGSHDYKIDADEAKKLGLNILPYDENLEAAVNKLYKNTASFLKLNTLFSSTLNAEEKEPIGIIIGESKKAIKYAAIQSNKINSQQGEQINIKFTPTSWEWSSL